MPRIWYCRKDGPQGPLPRRKLMAWAREKAWQRMTPQQRAVLKLRREGCCVWSIAAKLRLPYWTVRQELDEIRRIQNEELDRKEYLLRAAYS